MVKFRFFVICVLLGFLPLLHAQTGSTGSIVGKVRDTTGAAVPGVTVTATNIETGIARSTVSGDLGDYTLTPLAIGRYRIVAELVGFKTAVMENAVLRIGEVPRFDLRMELGEISESVTVTSESAVVKTDTASTSTIVSEVMIKQLPLDGRDYTRLAFLTAGVVPAAATYRQIGSVFGQRGQYNTFQLDGVETAEFTGGWVVLRPSVDAVQEFSLQKGIYSAEHGKMSGGVVNAAIKSGGNRFHGSLFEFVRNDILDARNFFSPGTVAGQKFKLPAYKRNQFGGTLGGPIIENRSFFFVTYEGYRIRRGATGTSTVPLPEFLTGDFSKAGLVCDPVTKQGCLIDPLSGNPFPDDKIPADRIHPVSAQLAKLWPEPNLPGISRNRVTSGSSKDDMNQFIFRVDHLLTPRDQLFVRGMWERLDNWNVPYIADMAVGTPYRNKALALGHTHTFSSHLINEFRFGATRIWYAALTAETGNDIAARLNIPLVTRDPRYSGYPNVSLAGYSGFGTGHSLPYYKVQNNFEGTDSVLWLRGRHSFKFGGTVQRLQAQQQVPLYKKGDFIFSGQYTGNTAVSGLADFLLGTMATTTLGVGDTLTEANLRTSNVFLYGQDDWRATDKLTLNLGLRWEYAQPPWDRYGKSRAFDPDAGELLPAPGTAGYSLVDKDLNNFAPRVGLAYRPFKDSNDTVIRAGAGLFYTQMDYDTWLFFPYNEPYGNTSGFYSDPVTPTLTWESPFPDAKPGESFPGAWVYGITRKDKRGYTQRWSLNVQRRILPETVLDIGYIGSKSNNLGKKIDVNMPPPGPGDLAERRPYHGINDYGPILVTFPISNETYHGLVIEVERSYTSGLYLRSSYVWSKAIGDVDASEGEKYNTYQDPRDVLSAEKGLSPWDMPHRFVLSALYDLPFGAGRSFLPGLSGVGQTILGGWQTAIITSANSGVPLTVTSGQVLNTGSWWGSSVRPHRIADGNLPKSQRTLDRFFDTDAFVLPPNYVPGDSGRRIIRAPGASNLDFAIYKNFALAERHTLQFRWEMFNALNHTRWGAPNTRLGHINFGRITSAAQARQMQFSLKYSF